MIHLFVVHVPPPKNHTNRTFNHPFEKERHEFRKVGRNSHRFRQSVSLFISSINVDNVSAGRSPPHRHAGSGNAERIEAEESLLLSSALLVHELDVVVQHNLRHDELERERGEEAAGTVLM